MNRRTTLRNLLIGFVILSGGGVAALIWLIASAAMSVPLGDSPVAPRAIASHRSERPGEDSRSIVSTPPSSAPVREEIAAATTIAPQVQEKPPVRWAGDTNRRATRTLVVANEALGADPDNPGALRDRAAALSALQRWSEAADTLDHLISVVPADARDTLASGTALARLSRWPAALKRFERLVELTPDEPRAWHNLAVGHQALGRLADARSAWDRVIELSPEDPDAYSGRGEVYCDLRQWREAAADFEVFLRMSPGSPDASLNLALAQKNLGLASDARQTVRALLAHHPRHVPAINRIAKLCWSGYMSDSDANARLRDDTIAWCRKSLDIASDQPEIAALLDQALERR